jgi:phosphate transport system substrate-binding protein
MKQTLLALSLLLVGGVAGAQMKDLNGAGSTFAAPIYTKWAAAYEPIAHIKINYQAIGSGGGKAQLSAQTVDFGGTDSPMTDAEIATAKGGMVVQLPTVIGAVAIAYNLPSVKAQIKLDGPVIADIYLGKITKWNDSRIMALNAGVSLPKTDIAVAHRSDGSGTTFIFTDYLSNVSADWAKSPGKGSDIPWPTGLGGKGNDGVAGTIKQVEGGIGYVELAYANQNHLTVALLKNKDGKWVAPTAKGATAAAAGVAAALPATSDFRVSIVNAPGPDAYPISSFTWLMVYRKQGDATKGKEIIDFYKWAMANGDAMAEALDYAPLPASLKAKTLARAAEIK